MTGRYATVVLASCLAGAALAEDMERAHAKIVARVEEGASRTMAAQAKLKDRVKLTDYCPETVNGTNTWGAALQRALDEHEIVVIPAGARYWIEKSVVMPSNRRIEAKGAEVALLPGVCTLLLRNAHAEDGTLSPIPRKVRGANVAVVGGRWIDWVPGRRGYGRTGRFNEGERRLGNFYGVSTLFYFGNVDGVTVRDATFVHTGGFAVQAGDATDLVFENIVFERCYADGLHLNGNLEGVLARNVRGSVGDDLVALNAYDWLNSSVNFGPQRFVLCEDLELAGESGYPAIRILPAVFRYRDGSEVDCAISDVIFRRVKGITTFKMYLQTPPYRIGEAPEWGKVGSGGNLFFEDSAIDLKGPIDALPEYVKGDPVRGHFGVFEFGANLTSVYLRNLEVTFHADRYPTSHLMTVGPKSSVPGKKREREVFDPYLSCRVGRVVLDGVRVRGAAPAELVHATSFKDVNGDGRSTGAGTIGEIVRREP